MRKAILMISIIIVAFFARAGDVKASVLYQQTSNGTSFTPSPPNVYGQRLGNGLSGTVRQVSFYLGPNTPNSVYTNARIAEYSDSGYSVCTKLWHASFDGSIQEAQTVDHQAVWTWSFTRALKYTNCAGLPSAENDGVVLDNTKYYVVYYWSGEVENQPVIYGTTSNNYGAGSCKSFAGAVCPSSVEDLYFVLEDTSENVVEIVYPNSSSVFQNDFSAWSLYVPSWLSTSTLSMKVNYGNISNQYYEEDSSVLNYTSLTSIYKITKGIALADESATTTWYARGEIYADYNGDGVFNNGVASSSEINFTVGPYQNIYGYTSIEGTPIYYDYYNNGTTTSTSTTKSCKEVDDGSASLLSVQGLKNVIKRGLCESFDFMFVPDTQKVDRFTGLLVPLQYKIPWGYAILAVDEFQYFSSTTLATTSSMAAAATVVSSSNFFSNIANLFKIGITALMWLLVLVAVYKLLVNFSI